MKMDNLIGAQIVASPLWPPIHGVRKYSKYSQRRKVTIYNHPFTNTEIYISDLPAKYNDEILAKSYESI